MECDPQPTELWLQINKSNHDEDVFDDDDDAVEEDEEELILLMSSHTCARRLGPR